MYFSGLRHNKEAVKRFLVVVFRALAPSGNGESLSGGCSKKLHITTPHVI
jgi:hypothetical protein